jgi:hypothetical protein
MPSRALRSVIDFGGLSQETLLANFQELLSSNIAWDRQDDSRIFEFLRLYFHSNLEVPNPQVIKDYFEARRDEECRERVDDLASLRAYSQANYTHLLRSVIEEQSAARALNCFREAQDIIRIGLILDNEERRGLVDGINHLVEGINQLLVLRGPQALRINFTRFERITQDDPSSS